MEKVNLSLIAAQTEKAAVEKLNKEIIELVEKRLIPELVKAAKAGRKDLVIDTGFKSCLVKPELEKRIICKKVAYILNEERHLIVHF